MPSQPKDLQLTTAADVHAAAKRLRGIVHQTPVLTSRYFDSRVGANSRLFFKAENFQRIGAFKFRGAMNALLEASADRQIAAVLTHSSGNHGQALALAAQLRGIRATVIMPKDSAPIKIAAVQGYGGDVVFCEPTSKDRERVAAEVLARTKAFFIHPFENRHVIAGQGTAALELATEVPDLDIVLTPVGGGGLLAGTAIALAAVEPACRVFGAEPEMADDAARSLAAGKRLAGTPATIADGLRSGMVGELAFAAMLQHVSRILTVSESDIIAAMRLVYERLKIVIEPSSAVPVAAVWRYPELFQGKRVGIILSGGNVDLARLPWM